MESDRRDVLLVLGGKKLQSGLRALQHLRALSDARGSRVYRKAHGLNPHNRRQLLETKQQKGHPITEDTNNLPQQIRATGADSVRVQRMARPLRETVKRMDCPSVMREHLWSIEREGMIECLWCFERRRSEDRERPSVGTQRPADENATP